MSFSEVVRGKDNEFTVLPEMRKEVKLIIKPKEKQRIEKTKEDLNENVDPGNLKISNIENKKNGVIVIQSENIEEREKIKNAIENKMNEKYEIKMPNPLNTTVIVANMTFKYETNELIEKLKKQNPVLESSELELIKYIEVKRNNRTTYNVKLKIDAESFIKVLTARKINIGWERCKVFDGVEIMYCYKCKGYNHKSNECKSEETCLKCHGNHKTSECNKEALAKCINCIRSNRKFNLGLDENHPTLSRTCPVYLNKLDIKKKNIGYSY